MDNLWDGLTDDVIQLAEEVVGSVLRFFEDLEKRVATLEGGS